MRIGHGYDAHKLVPGGGMTLGGIEIKCDYSLEAHSDGDILVHALIDALLGAAAYGDLGTYFPSEDQSLKNISSLSMLSTVLEKSLKLKEFDVRVINASVSGDTTSGGLNRLNWLIEGKDIDIVVLCLGANDMLRAVSYTHLTLPTKA